MIIFDLDGTLADCEHRRHFVDPTIRNDCVLWIESQKKSHYVYKDGYEDFATRKIWKPDWKAFYEACNEDAPIKPTFYFLNKLRPWNHVFGGFQIWSGRCESVREKTISWILKYSKVFCEYSGDNELNKILKMRPVGDNTPDDQLKEKWLDEALEQGKEIEYVFDDRPKVVKMWRRRGIFVFDCNQSGREF